MTRKQELEFANFICKFGDEVNMMDVFEDVVLPAFRSGDERTHGSRSWLVRRAEVVKFGDGERGLAFQFIKNTLLEREQVMRQGELVNDPKTLRSSPSAIGLLILDSHRLVYYPETRYAPSFSELQTTCQRLIRNRQKDFINELAEQDTSGESKKLVRMKLWQELPLCTLRIVPMAGEDDVSEIVRQYKVIKRVTIKLQAPNNEINWNPLFQKVEESRRAMGAKTAKLEHLASDGLNKTQTIREVSAASTTGNGDAYISGVNHDGARIEHNPDGFRTRVPVDIPEGSTPKRAAPIMKHKLDGLVEQGVLRAPAPEPTASSDSDDD